MRALILAIVLTSVSARSVKRDGELVLDLNDFHNDPSGAQTDSEQLQDEGMSNQIPNSFEDLPSQGERLDALGGQENPALIGEDELERNVTAMFLSNPCISVTCSDGAMCVVTNLALRQTECLCPSSCPDEENPVCSVFGKQYKSKCHLHLEACSEKRNIEIAYEGTCLVANKSCNEDELGQFAPRFLDWLMHIREEETTGEADMDKNVVDLPLDLQQHIAQWMFKRLDGNNNSQLETREFTSLIMYLMSVESCITEFLTSCDSDNSGAVTEREWKVCLVPGSNSVEDDYFDDI